MIPPTRLDRRGARELAGRMRNPRQREADLRAQLAAGRAGGERVAALIERFGIDTVRAGMQRDARLRRAPHARSHRRAARTACARRSDVLEAAEGDLELRLEARVEGDEIELDFTGSRRPARRQPQLPARRDAVRVLLRPARAHRPRRAALRGRVPAADRDRARGLAAQRPAAGRGGGRQRGDLVARGGPRAGGVRPRARSGHDEQPHARQRRLHLLRDARRRPGRVRRRRRPERRARGDVEHPQHADRGARAGVPAAGGRVRAAARLGRRRPPARRRRRGARARGAGRDALLADHRAPPARRRPGADGGEPGAPGRNLLNGEELPAKASGTLRPGDRLRIETPGGGGHGRALETGRRFVGLGIMGGPMARNLREAGFELSVYTRTREKAERFAAEHGARAAATPRRGRRGRGRLDHDGPRRAAGRGGAVRRRRRRRGAARRRAGRRHVHDRPHRVAGDRRAARDAARLRRGARIGLQAEGRGRHADDLRRRRRRATSSAPGRCSTRWAS